MNERDRRIARARLLRRQGKTYNEIREVIGPVDDKTLLVWCRGIPRPPETRRSHPLRGLRRECRRLRSQGYSYGEIAEMTGASKGSISPWVRDITPPHKVRHVPAQRSAAVRKRVASILSERAVHRREEIRAKAKQEMGSIEDRDLFFAGLALYWAEGSKDKPWRRNGRVVIINSDHTALALFLAWLDLLEVPEEERSYRLNIHESAEVELHEDWWATTLGIPRASFARATLRGTTRRPSGITKAIPTTAV